MTARLLGVVGTGTGVGKTVVAASLVLALRRAGVAVDALKPVATGVPEGMPGDDASLLELAVGAPPAGAAGARERVLLSFPLPRSPLAASAALGRTVDIDELVRRIWERAERGTHSVLCLEGVGGVMVPLTDQVTVLDLMRRLDAPVVIAAASGLGTINHSVLTVQACRHAGVEVAGVVLSDVGGDAGAELGDENARRIARQGDVGVLGLVEHLAPLRATAWGGASPPGAQQLAALELAAAGLEVEPLLCALGLDGGGPDQGAAARLEHLVRADRAHAWHPFTQTSEWFGEEPLIIRKGAGCHLIDERGNHYLDAISSLWANIHGHAHPALDRALHEQAGLVAHSTFLGQTHAPGALLAEELVAVAPEGLSRVFHSETGASAIEVALRVALLAQRRRGALRRDRFLAIDEGYHGDTAGAVSVGRSEPFHRHLDPLLFEAIRVPSPHVAGEAASLASLAETLDQHGASIAALVVEPRVQGAAGIWTHSDDWLRSVVAAARAAGCLVICDEVATGFGRTGDLFASEGAGIRPDILCLGKGLTGGYLPLAATLVGEELFDLFTGPHAAHLTLYYGHTYTANPLACAVARASLKTIASEGTVERGRHLAARLAERLPDVSAQPMVRQVRQSGVMVGVELAQEYGQPFDPSLRMGRRVCLAARDRGVVVRPLGDVVVINPPLVMSDREADVTVSAVAAAIASISLQPG